MFSLLLLLLVTWPSTIASPVLSKSWSGPVIEDAVWNDELFCWAFAMKTSFFFDGFVQFLLGRVDKFLICIIEMIVDQVMSAIDMVQTVLFLRSKSIWFHCWGICISVLLQIADMKMYGCRWIICFFFWLFRCIINFFFNIKFLWILLKRWLLLSTWKLLFDATKLCWNLSFLLFIFSCNFSISLFDFLNSSFLDSFFASRFDSIRSFHLGGFLLLRCLLLRFLFLLFFSLITFMSQLSKAISWIESDPNVFGLGQAIWLCHIFIASPVFDHAGWYCEFLDLRCFLQVLLELESFVALNFEWSLKSTSLRINIGRDIFLVITYVFDGWVSGHVVSFSFVISIWLWNIYCLRIGNEAEKHCYWWFHIITFNYNYI